MLGYLVDLIQLIKPLNELFVVVRGTFKLMLIFSSVLYLERLLCVRNNIEIIYYASFLSLFVGTQLKGVLNKLIALIYFG